MVVKFSNPTHIHNHHWKEITMSKKTLSEPQIKFLRERLDFLMEKYDVEATNFLNIINEEWPELEDYDFDNVEVDIWMDDEVDAINYTIEDMFRYLPNIDKLQYNECSAWCNNIKQFIIAVDEWEAERINITRFSLTSESLNLRFVENPFYIGIAALDQGIADDNYGLTPCSRYIAVEFEYLDESYLLQEDEIRILKQFLYTVSIETGVCLKLGQFFFFDYDYYDIDDEDQERNTKVNYGVNDLMSFTKAMDYFSKAIEIEDQEIKYLHFYKIIEYFSPVASKKSAYNLLNLRLDALKIKNRDQKYLESIFQLTRDYDTSLKDKKLATTVLRECVDSLELFEILPNSIQQRIKKKFHLQKDVDVTALNATEKDEIDKEIGQMLYSTRNQIVHAKSNYRSTGFECTTDDMEQLNTFMKKLCQCLIIWNNRQPDEYRLN